MVKLPKEPSLSRLDLASANAAQRNPMLPLLVGNGSRVGVKRSGESASLALRQVQEGGQQGRPQHPTP